MPCSCFRPQPRLNSVRKLVKRFEQTSKEEVELMSLVLECGSVYCPSTNYECISTTSGPTCVCKPGLIGSRCQLQDPCAKPKNPCNSNGACFPVLRNVTYSGTNVPTEEAIFHCQCYSGYSGNTCERGKSIRLVSLTFSNDLSIKHACL